MKILTKSPQSPNTRIVAIRAEAVVTIAVQDLVKVVAVASQYAKASVVKFLTRNLQNLAEVVTMEATAVRDLVEVLTVAN